MLLRLLLCVSSFGAVAAAPRLQAADGLRRLNVVEFAENSAWNRCHRRSQPDVASLPVWSGEVKGFFDDYRQLKDINRFIETLQEKFSDFVSVKEIGKSWEGRPIRLLELTDKSSPTTAQDKPVIFIEGGIHAREWIATSTVLFIVQALVEQATSPAGSSLLRKYVVAAVAPVNVDGYVYSWERDRMWRKTRSNRKAERCWKNSDYVAGVDANRNFGFSFAQTADRAYMKELKDPCSEVFIGHQPFSEPEVKAVADYMSRRQRRSVDARGPAGEPGPGYVAAFLDFHSYAKVLLPPWAYTAETPEAPDGDYQTDLTRSMVQAIQGETGRKFRAGADVFPPDPGTGPDWAYGELGIRATMTIELEGTMGTIEGGFCLNRAMIREVGREQLAALYALERHLDDNGNAPSTQIGQFASNKVNFRSHVSSLSPLMSESAAVAPALLVLMVASMGMVFLRRRWATKKKDVFNADTMSDRSWSPTSPVQFGRV